VKGEGGSVDLEGLREIRCMLWAAYPRAVGQSEVPDVSDAYHAADAKP
jgi:hypothetical protein